MKIGIDARCFASGKMTGVEEYTYQFLTALFTRYPNEEYHIFSNSWSGSGLGIEWMKHFPNVSIHHSHYPNRILNIVFWYFKKPHIDNLIGGVDVFLMPNINFAALEKNTPLILTLHDLSFEHFPGTFSWKRRLWHWLVNARSLTRRADHILTVSDATREDVMDLWDIESDRITRAYNGHAISKKVPTRNDREVIEVKNRHSLPYQFMLYFGTIEPRKNIISLIKAYNHLRATHQKITHKLVLAGSVGWKAKGIYRAIEESPYKSDIMLIHDVPPEEKNSFYVLADIFVYPSLFEGFGLPVLEALSMETPVITACTTAMPEVGRDDVITVDPTRPEEISAACAQIISSIALHRDLGQPNRVSLVRTFSWVRSVDIFMQKAREVAQK